MAEFEIASSIYTLIKDGGVLVLAILLSWAMHKRWIVPGWAYDEVAKQRDSYGSIIDKYSTRAEARIERLETERDRLYAASH